MMDASLRDTTAGPSTGDMAWRSETPCGGDSIILRNLEDCLGTIRTNRKRAMSGDPDAVHAIRVGLTRCRAVALFFRSCIRNDHWELLNKELDWLHSALGKARNLDVTVKYTMRKRYRDWADKSRPGLLRRQDKAHRQLAQNLRSGRCSRLISELDRWLETAPPLLGDKAVPPARFDAFCNEHLRSWRQALSREGRRVASYRRKKQHRFRIQSKDYRYVVETLQNCGLALAPEELGFYDIAKSAHRILGDLRDLRRLRKRVGKPPHYRKHRRRLRRRLDVLFQGGTTADTSSDLAH